MPPQKQLPRWSGTIPAGATRRLPLHRADGADELRLVVVTDEALKATVAGGRRQSDTAAKLEGSASLPWAAPEQDVDATSGAETGKPLSFKLYGAPDIIQVVLRNAGADTATVSVCDGGLV